MEQQDPKGKSQRIHILYMSESTTITTTTTKKARERKKKKMKNLLEILSQSVKVI